MVNNILTQVEIFSLFKITVFQVMAFKSALHLFSFLCAIKATKSLQFIEKAAKPGEISFGNFYKSAREEGAFLSKLGTLMSNHPTQSIDDCYFKCVESKDCLSVNVLSLENSQFHCQLLKWAGSNYEGFLVKKPNSWYMPIKVSCRAFLHANKCII